MYKKLSFFSLSILFFFACKNEDTLPERTVVFKGIVTIKQGETIKDDSLKVFCNRIIVVKCPPNAVCYAPNTISFELQFTKGDSTVNNGINGLFFKTDTFTVFNKTFILKDISPNPLKTDKRILTKDITIFLKIE